MLEQMHIANLATVDSLQITFYPGFSVLSGETGAGKSILIGALRFALGGIINPEAIRSGTGQTMVEAAFVTEDWPELHAYIDKLGIPNANRLVIRRLLREQGESTARVNDVEISQMALQNLGRLLVNIHGQHDNQLLLSAESHIDFLDNWAEVLSLREQLAVQHQALSQMLKKRSALEKKMAEQERETLLLQEQITALREANLSAEETGTIRHTLKRQEESGVLRALIKEVMTHLYENDTAVLVMLKHCTQLLTRATEQDSTLQAHTNQLQPLSYEIEDLQQQLSSYLAQLEASAGNVEALNARLSEIETATRPYGHSVEKALAALVEAEEKLDSMNQQEADLVALSDEIVTAERSLLHSAKALSAQRKQAAANMDRAVNAELQALGMDKAGFSVAITARASTRQTLALKDDATAIQCGKLGLDEVIFLLSPNPGQHARPLANIASGGELSRVMLALKTVLAEQDPTPTLIFDEVDSGISGGVAEMTGRKLRNLGAHHQVLCITHLPQIAALAQRHYLISKTVEEEQTYTQAQLLDQSLRVKEVARLLSGIEITGSAIDSAKTLIEQGQNGFDA